MFRFPSLARLFVLTLAIALATPASSEENGHAGALRHWRSFFQHLTLFNIRQYEWTEVNPAASWSPRAGLESVELGGRFFVMGGRTPLPTAGPALCEHHSTRCLGK
jgi:hypothetical protein